MGAWQRGVVSAAFADWRSRSLPLRRCAVPLLHCVLLTNARLAPFLSARDAEAPIRENMVKGGEGGEGRDMRQSSSTRRRAAQSVSAESEAPASTKN